MQHPLSYVNPDAQIGKDVEIGPFVTIDKNVVIGDGTRIMSNATILEGAVSVKIAPSSREPSFRPFHKISNSRERKQRPK